MRILLLKGEQNMFNACAKGHFVIGAKQVKNAIVAGKALKVYVASDSETQVISPIVELSQKSGLPLFYINTRKELGEMCSIEVKASCAAETTI